METAASSKSMMVDITELEKLIRRVVQETVRDELKRFIRIPNRSILEYWEHEGPDDPAGDQQLLADALELIEKYESNPEGWKTLEDFEEELAELEAADELPS